MSLPRPPRSIGLTLNLAPMVDVMMCLIIFFLLASRLVSAQHRPLALPYAIAATELPRSELGRREVVNVRATNDGLSAEYLVFVWNGKQIVERTLEPAALEQHLEREAAKARESGQTLRCVIRADRDVSYAHVEAVLRACGLAQVRYVILSANAGEDPEGGV